MIADTIIREGEAIPQDIVLHVPPYASLAFLRAVQDTTVWLWDWNPARAAGSLAISGITKDGTGAILGGCVVDLYETVHNVKIGSATSDLATGAYIFSGLAADLQFYLVAYKPGIPDLAGTTVDTVMAT